MLRLAAAHVEAHTAVINAHLIAHFAAQQFVDRHASSFARDVPQRKLNGADRRPPRLKAAEAANFEHDPFHIGGVFAQDVVLVKQDVRLEVRLAVLNLAVAVNAFIGHNAHNRAVANDGAAKINYFHGSLMLQAHPQTRAWVWWHL